MTMTIEFLRARLLSERSASKTAKLQIQHLAKKVKLQILLGDTKDCIVQRVVRYGLTFIRAYVNKCLLAYLVK